MSELRFDHIGVVVRTLAEGRTHLSTLLPIREWTVEFVDPVNGVSVQFGRDRSGICYEAVAPLGDESPLTLALRTGARILNHVAYRVANLTEAGTHLRENGCVPAGPPKPAIAYRGCSIQFFVTPLRFIIELVEAPDHEHLFTEANKQSALSIPGAVP
jgi:methylmalonyl-CoA/ethylmalonyl-CoA epimerase